MKPLLRQNSGLALPITLLLVAFNVTVLIALFVYATTELSASRNAAGSASSRIMALNGIDLAGALIAANSTNNAYVSYQNITNISGARLETKIANVVPKPDAVDASFQRQVTNPTALHSGFAAPGEGVDLNYATTADPSSGYILPRTNPTNSSWRNLHENMFQMKWVNVYKGPSSDPTNLIGRFAFWVDDESTKLNMNYSGATNVYSSSYDNNNWIRGGIYGPRADVLINTNLNMEFNGNLWPLNMELGGIAGLSRTNAVQILSKRGNPNWKYDGKTNTIFSPYYSILETRLGTLPPAVGGIAITNISQQSQLGFTATVYSREPEITFATGRPRFDLWRFTRNWESNAIRVAESTNGLMEAFNLNYPRFADKYSLPQFIAAIRANSTSFRLESNAAISFPYTPSGEETANYNARSMPLINETEVILKTRSDGVTNVTTLNASIELIFMTKAGDTGQQRDFTLFDKLHATKSRFEAGFTNYSANITFAPPLRIGSQAPITNITLTPDSSRWFKNYDTNDTGSLKPYDTDLTGLFAVLTGEISWTDTSAPNRVEWHMPLSQSINATISYFGRSYQSVESSKYNGIISNNATTVVWTNSIQSTNNANEIFYWWTSVPSGGDGVRGDPRLGIHSAELESAAGSTNTLGPSVTNPNASIGVINSTKTWKPDDFDNHPLSPDITPPLIFFATDRGLKYAQETPNIPPVGAYYPTSGDLGEIPITTFKSGYQLAWSTPRFWGDGRTNMGDGQIYPPDWLMLDCVHTAMFPHNTNRLFSTYDTNFVSYGRLNINGLKTFFQTPLGSQDRSDTVVDSFVIETRVKDFRDVGTKTNEIGDKLGGKGFKVIDRRGSYRTNLLNYINQEALRRGSQDDPFLTGFDFTAKLAGITNFIPDTNNWKWEFYSSENTNTTDSRIEGVVRAFQQRVTSRGFQFSVFSLGQSLQVVKTGDTYKTNVIGESYFQAVWERAPKHDTNGIISNASSGGAPPLRLLYMRELR